MTKYHPLAALLVAGSAMAAGALAACQPAGMSPSLLAPGDALAPSASLVAVGDQALLLDRGGRLWEWGLHPLATTQAQRPARSRPVAQTGLGRVKAVAASEDDGHLGSTAHVLAVRDDGTVWAWGDNDHGEGGHADPSSEAPVQVAGLAGATAVEAGWNFSLALKGDGTVWAWGRNAVGQLGDGTETGRPRPGQVAGLKDVTMVRAGRRHAVALTRDGQVWTWGANDAGQLGVPLAAPVTRASDLRRPSAAAVPGLANVVEIAASADHSLARLADGSVMGWGRARAGVLGGSAPGNTVLAGPVAVPGATGVRALASGRSHVLALVGDGQVLSWGSNDLGELGRGTAGFGRFDAEPKVVEGLSGVVAIAAGRHASLALDRDGRVWAWGSNYAGHGGRGEASLDGVVKPAMVLAPSGDGAWKLGD